MKNISLFKIITLSAALFSYQSYAQYTLGQSCKNGKAYLAGGEALGYVKAKGPTHAIVNTKVEFTGDTNLGFFEDIKFYYEADYYATDQANIQGVAYKTIPLNGLGVKWITATWGSACSYTEVVVHNAPYIINTSLIGGSTITTSITSRVDSNSKGQGLRNITYTYKNLDYNMTETYKVSSSLSSVTTNFNPTYNGEYRVSVSLSDGLYYDGAILGTVYYGGGQECTSCGNIN